MSKSELNLKEFKHRVIDTTLLLGFVFGCVAYFSVERDLFTINEGWNEYADLIALFLILATYLLRNKIPLKVKALIFFLILFNLVISDAAKYGLYSPDKIFLVLIPFYGLLFMDSTKTIILYLLAALGYLVVGYFFISGTLELPVNLLENNSKISHWIESILIISIVSVIVSAFSAQYNRRFSGLIDNLEQKNKDLEKHQSQLEEQVKTRTRELESANEELHKANIQLSTRNHVVSEQKDELEETLQDLKEAQARLIDSEKMASLGVLTAGVSHELNNPLNFIKGGYHGLATHIENIDPDNEDLNILLNSIKEGVDRASEIVNGLNKFSRENETYDETCDIPEIMENCLHMLNNVLKSKVTVEKQYDEVPTIPGNVGKLHQVFVNLLTNACQAIDKKGDIKIGIKKDKAQIQIQVSDNGSGIPDDIINRITEPFFTTKEPGEGTGLGLSISYSIIKAHQGNLAFESTPGKGTIATVTLPSR